MTTNVENLGTFICLGFALATVAGVLALAVRAAVESFRNAASPGAAYLDHE